MHRRQRRLRVLGERDVIEADDRQVVWDPEGTIPAAVHGADRHQIVGCDDRRGSPAVDEPGACEVAPLNGEVRVAHTRLESLSLLKPPFLWPLLMLPATVGTLLANDVRLRRFLLTLERGGQSRATLQLEALALRHQLQALERSRPPRLHLARAGRLLWVWTSLLWKN